QVDHSRDDERALGVVLGGRRLGDARRNCGDAAVSKADVTDGIEFRCGVDDASAAEDQVHGNFLSKTKKAKALSRWCIPHARYSSPTTTQSQLCEQPCGVGQCRIAFPPE